VTLAASSLTGDQVDLEIWESFGIQHVDNQALAVEDGSSTVAFSSDLGDDVLGFPLLSEGVLTLASFLERDGLRSTMRISTEFHQDTIPPGLIRFGPPFDAIASRFRTDLPHARPYGVSTEPVSTTAVAWPLGGTEVLRSAGSSPQNAFTGSSFDPGPADGSLISFDMRLVDDAGNPMSAPVQGTVVRRGFLGQHPNAGSCLIEVFDAGTLAPLHGATVYIEDYQTSFIAPGSRNEDSGVTGSDGRVEFFARAVGVPQTVTVVLPGYHACSLVGYDSEFASLPMRPELAPSVSVSPSASNVSGGTLTIASGLLQLEPGKSDVDGMMELLLPLSFTSLNVLADRPGWYAAFHEVSAVTTAGTTQFERVALDDRVLVDAVSSASASAVAPHFALGSSTNSSLGTATHIFDVGPLSGGAGLGGGLAEVTFAAEVRIPGIVFPAVVGTGGGYQAGSNRFGVVEIEPSLLAAAILEGAPADFALIRAYAENLDGDAALARLDWSGDLSLGGFGSVALPSIPTVQASSGTLLWPDVALHHKDVSSQATDWHHLTLTDNAPAASEWDLWTFGDSDSADESVILPSLAPASGAVSDPPPLLTTVGSSWTLEVEVFQLDTLAFPSVLGVHFAQLLRDCQQWSLATPGSSFEVR
ncbi:MAG: hypothetical protein MK213_06365, partial [Planctomycetes bacterium]|nr:hypothetical protein [Planctomycetota bacterium]